MAVPSSWRVVAFLQKLKEQNPAWKLDYDIGADGKVHVVGDPKYSKQIKQAIDDRYPKGKY